jgi:hypothetical protein
MRSILLPIVLLTSLVSPMTASARPRFLPAGLLQAPPATAAPPPAAAQGGPVTPAQAENISPGELNRLFEAYALLQAQNMLRLTDDQYADFIVRLKALHNARRRHQVARLRLIGDMRRMTAPQAPPPDDAALKTALDALAREEAASAVEIGKATEQVDELLDLRQRARFRVFEEQLERQKLDLLSRVRRNAPRMAPGNRPLRDKPGSF